MSPGQEEIFTTVRTEGGLLPPHVLSQILKGDKDLKGASPATYHLAPGERINEATSRSWTRLSAVWRTFRGRVAALSHTNTGTSLTRDNWLLILFQELGYGRLQKARGMQVEGRGYPVSHVWGSTPIHLLGLHVGLDRKTAGVVGAARMSPHGVVQELLNRSDQHLWGIVSNGIQLRVLRGNASLTRQAYIEFDLKGMMEGEVYTDFVLLWLLCHQSRFEVQHGRPKDCWLERWAQQAQQQGTRALDRLRDGVQEAVETLGAGFLAHRRNATLRDALRCGKLSTQDYYRELLRLVYRLLFLFVAEDRELLLRPDTSAEAQQRYRHHYSTARLRRLALAQPGSNHHDLYCGLRVVMQKLGEDEGFPALGLPALGSYLWSAGALPNLQNAAITNRRFLTALRALSLIRKDGTNHRVDYRNLGAEELGSVYESLLELQPTVDTVVGAFSLSVTTGHDRRMTSSYYTPASLVEELLDSALDPVLDDAMGAEDPQRAILSLKVCDPAVGSGHFLIAAAHRIARRLTFVRTGEEEASPKATRLALRDVLGHCLYGVDVNPMAVELCKVSLWLEALEPGKPLSFLDHRILCGNSILGTTPALLAKGIPDIAFTAIEGDDKRVVADLRRRNRNERQGQQSFHLTLVAEPTVAYGNLRDRMEQIDALDDRSIDGIHRKEAAFRGLTASAEYRQSWLLADAWCAAFVWPKQSGAPDSITTDTLRQLQEEPKTVPQETVEHLAHLTKEHRFFHWHLAFPDVFPIQADEQGGAGITGCSGGFDAVIANPPYASAAERKKRGLDPFKKFWHTRFPSARGAYDLYILFLDLAQTLLSRRGRAGLLTPNKYLAAPYAETLRSVFVDRACLLQITDVSDPGSFADVSVYPIITTVAGRRLPTDAAVLTRLPQNAIGAQTLEHPRSLLELMPCKNWNVILSQGGALVSRLLEDTTTLGELCEICASTTASEADAFGALLVDGGSAIDVATDNWKCLNTGLIDPFCVLWGERGLRHSGRVYERPLLLDDPSVVSSRRRRLYNQSKIIVAKLALSPEAFFDASGEFAALNVNFVLCPESVGYYYLALLNSELMKWTYGQYYSALSMGGKYMQFQAPQLKSLPIMPYVGSSDQVRLGELAKQAGSLSNAATVTAEIDHLVAEVYALTKRERMLVRSSV